MRLVAVDGAVARAERFTTSCWCDYPCGVSSIVSFLPTRRSECAFAVSPNMPMGGREDSALPFSQQKSTRRRQSPCTTSTSACCAFDLTESIGCSKDIGGRKIRVHLERDSPNEFHARRPSNHLLTEELTSTPPSNGYWQPIHSHRNEALPPSFVSQHSEVQSSGDFRSPVPARTPWALDMSLNGNQSTPTRVPAGIVGAGDSSHVNFRNMHHPGPISMPPFPSLDNGNQFSPFQTRNLPPMTPSMPGFVFNAYPETPPVHAHFLSPGIGPFSPGIPVTSPTGFAYNPFLNPAPGAPVNRLPQGGSAQLGTPSTQSFPNNPVRGYAGPPGQAQASQASTQPAVMDYFPTQTLSSAGDSLSSNFLPSRSNFATSPLNPKDRPTTNRQGGTQGDLSHLTARMSLQNAQSSSPPMPASRVVQSQRSVSGLDLVDLARADTLSARASLDGSRPMLDLGWNGERRASYGDIGSRETK